jgi:membrane-associated phospholipid phosphatase
LAARETWSQKGSFQLGSFLCVAQLELPWPGHVKAAKHEQDIERCRKFIRDQDGSLQRADQRQRVFSAASWKVACFFWIDQTLARSSRLEIMRAHTAQTRKRIYIHVRHFTTPSCTHNILQPFVQHNQTFDFFASSDVLASSVQTHFPDSHAMSDPYDVKPGKQGI